MAGKQFGSNNYCPPGFVDSETPHGARLGDWRKEAHNTDAIQPISRLGSNNYSKTAKLVRESIRDYFSSEQGALQWQWDHVTSTENTFDM